MIRDPDNPLTWHGDPEDGKAKEREAEAPFKDGDMVLYVFDPRAEDVQTEHITRMDDLEFHEELISRRNFRGCIKLMDAAEVERKKQEARAVWNWRKEA